MLTPLQALDAACDFFREQGGQLALADAIGIKSPSISGWRKALIGDAGRSPNPKAIPQDRCEPIEAATTGRVHVEELRPDLLWKRDPDGRVIGVITPIQPTARKRSRRVKA